MHKCNRTDGTGVGVDFFKTLGRSHVHVTLKTVGTGLNTFGMNTAENTHTYKHMVWNGTLSTQCPKVNISTLVLTEYPCGQCTCL